MRYWLAQSKRPGFSCVPVGAMGWFIFITQMACFILGTLMCVTMIKPDAFPAALNSPRTGIILIAIGTFSIAYTLIFKTDFKNDD